MELGSDPVRQGRVKPRRRRNVTIRQGSVFFAPPTIEALEPRTLLSGASEPLFTVAIPPPAVPALVLPVIVSAVAGSGTGAAASSQATSVEQSGSVVNSPQMHVIVLTPVAGDVAFADGSDAAESAKDVRRTIDLGNMATFRASDAPKPEVFDFGGQSPAPAAPLPEGPTQAGPFAAAAMVAPVGYTVNLPAAPRVDVEGNFDATESYVAVSIPVGPLTQSVRMVLHPQPDAPGGESPAFGKILLLDPSGQTLAEIDPGEATLGGLPDDVTVAMQNAPAGGQLVVRVTGIPSSASAGGSQNPSIYQSNLPFLLEVQSQNQSNEGQSAANASESGVIGTLVVTAASSSNQTSQPSNSTSPEDPASDAPINDQTADIPQAGDPVNDNSGDSEGGYVRMATGPLVSRSSGPLGPVLAAIGTDLTPPVDRHERALLQEIPNLASERESENSIDSIGTGRWALAQVEDDSARSGQEPGERYVTVVLGAGGFPMKVTSRPSGDRAGLAGLLAALPQPVQPPSSSDDSPARSLADASLRPVEIAADISYPADRRGYPGYLKAAWGLVLGLGLTSGPLFSDLITSLRQKASRWRPVGGSAAKRSGAKA